MNKPLKEQIFLSGPAGCGKTTVGVERLRSLLDQDFDASSILVLTPQRTLQEPYESLLHDPKGKPGGQASLATIGGLARRLVNLFWPMIAEPAGFSQPEQQPVFLTLETAQYFMARLVRPLLDEGLFASVTIDRNRLYSQVLDNLNKAAAIGFPHTEIGERLTAAWFGDPAQPRIYADAQEAATRFRKYCLDHNLLDFSLQLELFRNVLWPAPECRQYLFDQYHHLIYDNVEEDIPIAHDMVLEWLPHFESALIIFDEGGGYRRFLGADPESAQRLKGECPVHADLVNSFVTSKDILALEQGLASRLQSPGSPAPKSNNLAALNLPAGDTSTRFFPQMLDWVADQVQSLIKNGDGQTNASPLRPNDIVILAPFFSDSLRLALGSRLEERGIPWQSHRPSRTLRDEPASRCLLTLAALAHPGWKMPLSKFDVAYALMGAIEGMDLVRAQLLAEIVFRQKEFALSSFSSILSEMQERITYVFGQHFELLRLWLEDYRQSQVEPLDHFLSRLFGEILSQKGFGFHNNPDGSRTAASLVESVKKFRQVLQAGMEEPGVLELGREYLLMLQEGVIAAQYVEAWQPPATDAVLLAPAFTFLMMNRPVAVQFWLDAGSSGWWERLFQPLTQPYVLSRQWEHRAGSASPLWTDADETRANQETLSRLVSGLLRRCRERVVVGISDLGESGFEQRSPLLKAIWRMQLENQASHAA